VAPNTWVLHSDLKRRAETNFSDPHMKVKTLHFAKNKWHRPESLHLEAEAGRSGV
jgi:hypothetical protein